MGPVYKNFLIYHLYLILTPSPEMGMHIYNAPSVSATIGLNISKLDKLLPAKEDLCI
jgi:hypothetical protein